MPKHSIAVVGSRTYPVTKEWWDNQLDDEGRERIAGLGRAYVESFMDELIGTTVVSGGAAGPDTWAANFAKANALPLIEVRPNWKKYGKGAGLKRNQELVDLADDVVAFWDLESGGTWDTIRKAAKAEKDLLIFGPSGQPWLWFTQEDYKGGPGLLEKMLSSTKLEALRESIERSNDPESR